MKNLDSQIETQSAKIRNEEVEPEKFNNNSQHILFMIKDENIYRFASLFF